MANTQLTEEERKRLAMMQAQMDTMRWRTANQFPGSAAYTSNPDLAPDPGPVPVGPVEALIGGPGVAAARVGTRVAPSILNLLKSEGAKKALSRAKTFFVRPGYSGGARPTFTRVPGGGRGKWKRPDTWKRNPDPPHFNPSLGPGSYLAMGAGGAAAALMDGDETPTTEVGLLEAAGAPVATNATTPTDTTTAVEGGLLADDPNYVASGDWTPAGKGGRDDPSLPGNLQRQAVATVAADTERSYQIPDPDASTVGKLDVSQIAPAKQQELERVWGKYTYSPKERHNKFMEQLNSIYMKAAWLDVIASLTGGTSQSAQYISRATSKLEMMAKFDQEERLYNIWRDVYHDENGTYDPPKSKKEAAERARRLGASPEETQKIYGWSEEQDDLVSWWRPADNERKYEVKTTHGKKERPARGTGADWIMGSPPDSLTAPVAKTTRYDSWTDGTTTIRVERGRDGPPGYYPGTATTTGSDSMWAVPPGGGAAKYVLKSRVASEEGWTKSTQIQGNRLERAIDRAEAHLKGDGGERAARAELKIFFSSDAMSYLMFAKNIEKTVDEQIANIKAARIAPIGAPDNRDDAEKALRVAKPKPDDVSLEDYEAAIKEALDRLYPDSS